MIFFRFLAFFFALPLFGAMPYFHAYIAEEWIEMYEDYGPEEKRAFLVGTLFPDIRYLGTASRSETHDADITVQELLGTDDPFTKGKKLHSFVDETRVKILAEYTALEPAFARLLDALPGQNQVTFLKMLEDEIIYPERYWGDIFDYLQEIDRGETGLAVPIESVRKWHWILSWYFSYRPSDLLAWMSWGGRGFFNIPPPLVQTWSALLFEVAQDEAAQKYVSFLVQRLREEMSPVDPLSKNLIASH